MEWSVYMNPWVGCMEVVLSIFFITISFNVYRVSYAEISGTHYSKGMIVLCTFDEDVPIFGKILDIIVTASGECLFALIPCIGKVFCKHFNAYEVYINTMHHFIYRPKDLVDHHTLSLSKSFASSVSYICMKYHVFV